MGKLYSAPVNVDQEWKEIAVFCDDVTTFREHIDILTTSAYVGSYAPTPRTVFHALSCCGIAVDRLAQSPVMDLRNPCHIWLSQRIFGSSANIGRIGCVEFMGGRALEQNPFETEQTMVNSIRAYFQMLDIAAVYGVRMDTLALPLLGSGRQGIASEMLIVPLVNECIGFLKRNPDVRRIYFIEKNPQKAEFIADHLRNSLRFQAPQKRPARWEDTPAPIPEKSRMPSAFISYSSGDRNIADNLCAKLERRGIRVWYAPRNVKGAYAESIVQAIDGASFFIVILSRNSIASQHVLNEIDLAFQHLPGNIKFKPLRIDDAMFTPSFKYYLSRQHWLDASIPPLEDRLNEFVEDLLRDI